MQRTMNRERGGGLYRAVLAILSVVCILLSGSKAAAVNASPLPFDVVQPNGKTIQLFMRGDEHYHWVEDAEGYTVVEANGAYHYAERDASGNLQATALVAGSDSPAGFPLHLKAAPERIAEIVSRGVAAPVPQSAPDARITPVGTVKQLIIMMRFSNHTTRTLPSNADINVLLNAVGGHPTIAPTGSVRDVYLENSYGQFTLNSTIIGWVNLPQTEQYYANNESGLGARFKQAITDALTIADASINFSQFDTDLDGFVDAIGFVHSGYSAEYGGTDQFGTPSEQRIWSHKGNAPTWTSQEGVKVSPYYVNPGLSGTSGTDIGNVGVFCHEAGHFFGLPDLYDTDSSPGEGVGSWCLMGNPWGFDGTDQHPPHMCSWSKIQLGWVTPTVVNAPGIYSLPQWETSPSVYRINQGFPTGEYLLVENREPVGIETDMPQGGLIVLHVDDNAGLNIEGYPGQLGWPENGYHYRVSVLQADGHYDLDRGVNRGGSGDPFHGNGVDELTPDSIPDTDAYQGGRARYTGNTLTNISAAGSSMNFTLGFGDSLRLSSAEKVWWTFDSAGPAGGPFSPPSRVFQLQNASSSTPLTANITSFEPWLESSTPAVGIGASGVNNVTLSVAPEASLLPVGNYTAAATIEDAGTGFSYAIDARLNVSTLIADFPMNTDPGWTHTGVWQFGAPHAQAGDPPTAKTGTSVYGYNLNGAYTANLAEQFLRTKAINCSAYGQVALRFWRWLGVEAFPRDRARIQASIDGVNFQDVWVHSGATINDGQWVEQLIDLTPIAAGQPAVYVQWIMGSTDGVNQFCGWNIDDVSLWGVPSGLQTIAQFNFTTDPHWTTEGLWSWGVPQGIADDPLVGHNDSLVYGFNLTGAYPDLIPERRLTSTPINCSGYSNVHLSFWRWLTIEDSQYDHARVQVSKDGVNFTDVWVHNGPTLLDTQWVLQNFDISAVADGQSTVYLRWVMGDTDDFVNYGGWNIDDVALQGVPGAPSSVVWVDFAHAGAQKGTQALPYRSALAGVSKAKPDQTIRFRGDSTDTSSNESFTLRKPLRLESSGGVVSIGAN